MKKLIVGVAIAGMLLALFSSSSFGQIEYSNVTVTVVCYNVSIYLITDDSVYQYTEVINMTVFINNTENQNNLSEMLLIDLLDSGYNFVKNMIVDNATAPAGGINITSYYRNLSDISPGNYVLRARIVPMFSYPEENITARDCTPNNTPIRSDANITITQLRPNPPTNLKAILNKSDEEITLNWTLSNSTNIFNYIIYKTDDWSAGFNFSDPYDTVSNTTQPQIGRT